MTWENVIASLAIVALLAALAHLLGITTRTKRGPLPGIVAGVAIPLFVGACYFSMETVTFWQSILWMVLAFAMEAITGAVLWKWEAGETRDIVVMLEKKLTGGSESLPESHLEYPFPLTDKSRK